MFLIIQAFHALSTADLDGQYGRYGKYQSSYHAMGSWLGWGSVLGSFPVQILPVAFQCQQLCLQ